MFGRNGSAGTAPTATGPWPPEKSVSECFKASHGDLNAAAALTGGVCGSDTLTLRYDENWTPLSEETDQAAFLLELTMDREGGVAGGSLRVYGDGEEPIVSWPATALEVTP